MTSPSKQPFKTVADYLAWMDRNTSDGPGRKSLLDRAKTAAAWGVPDHESTGYTHSELTSIISELVRELEKTYSRLAQR